MVDYNFPNLITKKEDFYMYKSPLFCIVSEYEWKEMWKEKLEINTIIKVKLKVK